MPTITLIFTIIGVAYTSALFMRFVEWLDMPARIQSPGEELMPRKRKAPCIFAVQSQMQEAETTHNGEVIIIIAASLEKIKEEF